MWRWDQQEPFGNNVPDENPSGLGLFEQPLRFPGQYADKETNLHYNMARNYWPDGGRYVEGDPLGIATTWPRVRAAGLNHLYSYAGANPIKFIDPLGLCASDDLVCQAFVGQTSIPRLQHLRPHLSTSYTRR